MKRLIAALFVSATCVTAVLAQQQMPNPKEISGVPLPDTKLPPGTVSVRVVRGAFDKDITGQSVEFTVDGKTRVQKTDAQGRTQIAELKPGTHVVATTTVDGERLTSQDITVGSTGVRIVLVATDPEATKRAAEDQRLAAGPAAKGAVVLGPQSRVIAEFNEDRLNVFYLVDIVNTARTPVDIGGPLVFDLPREARGAFLSGDSTRQATVNGPHVTVLGPFAPGATSLQVGFELPFSGDTAHLKQVWPVTLQTLNVIVGQSGHVSIRSPQITDRRDIVDQGPPAIAATGPAISAGQSLDLDISGLPHHPIWPRYLALALSGAIMAAGIWAAVFPSRRRPA